MILSKRSTGTDPPVEKKPGWFKRLAYKVVPEKYHDRLDPWFTKEVVIAYNVSSFTTLAQVALVSKWHVVAAWWSAKISPTVQYGLVIIRKTWDNLLSIINTAS